VHAAHTCSSCLLSAVITLMNQQVSSFFISEVLATRFRPHFVGFELPELQLRVQRVKYRLSTCLSGSSPYTCSVDFILIYIRLPGIGLSDGTRSHSDGPKNFICTNLCKITLSGEFFMCSKSTGNVSIIVSQIFNSPEEKIPKK
jgi:hypothetical protein